MTNTLVDLVNTTATGAITTSTDLMSGPIGYVVYLVLGLSVLWLIVFTVKKWF